MNYSLDELKYANEICFPDTFEQLLKKHLPKEDKGLWVVYLADFKGKYKSDLLAFIFNYSRADYLNGFGVMFEAMLNDLIDGYRK